MSTLRPTERRRNKHPAYYGLVRLTLAVTSASSAVRPTFKAAQGSHCHMSHVERDECVAVVMRRVGGKESHPGSMWIRCLIQTSKIAAPLAPRPSPKNKITKPLRTFNKKIAICLRYALCDEPVMRQCSHDGFYYYQPRCSDAVWLDQHASRCRNAYSTPAPCARSGHRAHSTRQRGRA